jgi:hypothetical protein
MQTHQVGRKVSGAFLPHSRRDMAAVATSDSDLVQHDGLVFPASDITQNVFFSKARNSSTFWRRKIWYSFSFPSSSDM